MLDQLIPMKQCQAKTKTGDQCKNNAIPGTDFCYLKSHGSGHVNCLKRALNVLVNKWSTFLIMILLAVITIVVTLQVIQDNPSSGVIETEDEATEKTLAIGGIKIILETSNDVVVRDNGEPVLSIRMEENKLFVSAVIRGDNGDLLAEIRDNEWKLNENNYFDRNYSDNALEVRDRLGNIALQVVSFGDVIHFAGIFHTKDGHVVSFVPLQDLTAAIEIRPSEKDLQLKISPIFEYPSELHLGSCPGIENLEGIVRAGTSTFHFGGSIDIGTDYNKGEGIIKLV